MRMMLEAGLVLLCAALFLLMTAVAVKAQATQTQQPAAKAEPAPPVEEEIIVRGRRNEPDFQEEWEHHRKEFDRLSKIYGDPFTPNRRSDRMTDTPNPDKGKSVMRSPGSDTIQGRPSRD